MTRRMILTWALFGAVFAAAAKEPKSAFERVPKAALTELKATVGKPFSAGLVFVNGQYLEPPYTVERWGTAIRINGTQVTGQVVAWNEFLKTQSGVKIVEAAAPAAAVPSSPAEAEEEAEDESEVDDDCDLDDLFEGSSVKTKAKKAAPPKAKKPVPVAAPAPTVTVTFDGEFVANAQTKEMVEEINRLRTKIELTLRKGGYCFFGSRHRLVTGERRVTEIILTTLPGLMKENSDRDAFLAAAARKLSFLPGSVQRELFAHRFDYLKLQERAKNLKGERQWGNLLSQ